MRKRRNAGFELSPSRASRLLAILGVALSVGVGSGAALGSDPVRAGEPSAGEALLAAALTHHDPHDAWSGGRFRLVLEALRPDGSTRRTALEIDNQVGSLAVTRETDGGVVEAEIGPGDRCVLKLDGSPDIAPGTAARLRLNCERWRTMRDYYHYMWGLPMKLGDAGTIIDDEVEKTEFNGAAARALRVTYEAETGGDTWIFYFDPATSRAVGYRFYHDPEVNDGEYIVLDGEVEAGGVRFPRSQTWYMNDDDELLGSDVLISAERLD